MSKMSYLEERILEILQSHKGKDNPITVQKIQKLTCATPRKIRKTIANLVTLHRIPIASSVNYPYGFYLITDKDEAETCLRQYWSRVKEVARRAKILETTIKDKFGVSFQKEFDFNEERKPST